MGKYIQVSVVNPIQEALDAIKEGAEGVDVNMTGKGMTSPTLKAVSDYPFIKDEGAKKIAKALEENKTCKALDLSGNEIGGDGGVKALARMLKSNNTLEKLYLENNEITSNDVKYLADSLVVNATLKELRLNGNKIDNTGAIALAKALTKNKNLKALSLNRNSIRDEGAKELAKVLRPEIGVSLEELSLNFNNIRDGGAKKLMRNLMENQSLLHLGLSGNKIYFKGSKYLNELFESRKDVVEGPILSLSLDHNRISDSDFQLLNDLARSARCDLVTTSYVDDRGTKSAVERVSNFVKYRVRVKRYYQNGHYRNETKDFLKA